MGEKILPGRGKIAQLEYHSETLLSQAAARPGEGTQPVTGDADLLQQDIHRKDLERRKSGGGKKNKPQEQHFQ